MLASGFASPQLLENRRRRRRRRRPDRCLHADSLNRRRRHHYQPSRHCSHQHLPPSDTNASHRQQRSHHHRSSCMMIGDGVISVLRRLDHHATNNTASFSRLSAYKETKDQAAEVHDKTTYTVLPRQDGE